MALRIGIVGCGKIAGNHARALQQVTGVEVVGCCDPDVDRAREFASAHGIARAVGSVGELIALGLDACTVCTRIRCTSRWSSRPPRPGSTCCARSRSRSTSPRPTG